MDCTSLFVYIPVCGFRCGRAREYLETERVPPPSTVYGFLLSLLGEWSREAYLGTRIAYALVDKPELSVTLRTAWRIKVKNVPPGVGSNRRPDYQELLTGLKIALFVAEGKLSQALDAGQADPSLISRHGGLSMGESRDLINDIIWRPDFGGTTGLWVVPDEKGEIPLPIWVDHVGSSQTRYRQFRLKESDLKAPDSGSPAWITIEK